MIKLTSNSFSNEELNNLSDWIKTNPRLSQGDLTKEFEKAFSNKFGKKYSVYVNSGSSANLLMMNAMSILHGNGDIVIPAVSWSTSIAPVIQLGLTPIICDVDLNNYGADLNQLEYIFKKYKPTYFLSVNILGFSPNYELIEKLCNKYNVILLNDNCESLGSTYKGKHLTEYGKVSTHSFFYSHQLCTIEGGMICTNDKDIYNILLMLRAHGWDRDLDQETKKLYRDAYNIDDFNALYTFYVPGYCFRNTQIGAFLGISQLEKFDNMVDIRENNFNLYQENINNHKYKVKPEQNRISNFAYPIIHEYRDYIVEALQKNNIECRPIVAGNMTKQPFIKKSDCIIERTDNANIVDKYGLYIPNNPDLTKDEILDVCNVINGVI